MLGVVLVTGIMALLLLGTLRGLWSYYLTVNNSRSKVVELKAAEDLREVVARLVAPHTLAYLDRNPGEVDRKMGKVLQKLAEYKNLLHEHLPPGQEEDNGSQESGYARSLTEHLELFRLAVLDNMQARMWGPGGRQGSPDDDPEVLAENPRVSKDLLETAGYLAGLAASPGNRACLYVVTPVAMRLVREYALAREVKALTLIANDLRSEIYGQLDRDLSESRRHYQISLWIIVPSSVLGLTLMAGLMRSFYAWIFYPVRDLEAGVNRVASGDFEHRITVDSGDEMEDLAKAFNAMTQRLQDLYSDLARQVNERSRQLVRSERLASVGFLAAGVAHEINNPLASIAFCSEALEARLLDLVGKMRPAVRINEDLEVFTRYLKMIQEEAFRCKTITERLLEFSRPGERRREPTDLGQVVQSVLDITQHLQHSRGKHLTFEPQGDRGANRIVAPVNAEEIKSVVLNLVVNALDSMEEGGRLTIRLREREGMAELEFTDTGCGMTQEVLENIFEPFFTRSRTGKGTGLGLTISHRIINQHGGEIEATSPGPNQGSTFTVRLPLQSSDAPGVPANGPRLAPEMGRNAA